jgi:G-protein alpha subunit
LIGPGESGKSTVFKQMKILQQEGGFLEDELLAFAPIIVSNTISQMRVLVQNAARLQKPLDSDKNQEYAQHILTLPEGGDYLDEHTATALKSLWADSAAQATYALRDKEFQLNDSAEYFFESAQIDRVADANFLPSEQDVLRARVRSTGIEEAEFYFEDLAFRMFDVGGQRSERRKWIHCFDCVTAVLFVVSLCGYDQVLREDETQNRMKESLLLFDEIVNSPWFCDTSFILFLNKIDLFREKIKTADLRTCFPNYNGGASEKHATDYIKDLFMDQKNSDQGGKREIFVHVTCAVDSENIAVVFRAVQKKILDEILQGTGVLM